MIISVEEAKRYINTSEEDSVLEAKLQALELLIRKYTNNNFQKRAFRSIATIKDGKLYCDTYFFKEGDTVEISESRFNEGLLVVKGMEEGNIPCEGHLGEENILVTKVEYPADVKMGVIDMLDWKLKNPDKIGVQSETLSRHSQTFDRAGIDKDFGVPKELVGFLRPYMKARF